MDSADTSRGFNISVLVPDSCDFRSQFVCFFGFFFTKFREKPELLHIFEALRRRLEFRMLCNFSIFQPFLKNI